MGYLPCSMSRQCCDFSRGALAYNKRVSIQFYLLATYVGEVGSYRLIPCIRAYRGNQVRALVSSQRTNLRGIALLSRFHTLYGHWQFFFSCLCSFSFVRSSPLLVYTGCCSVVLGGGYCVILSRTFQSSRLSLSTQNLSVRDWLGSTFAANAPFVNVFRVGYLSFVRRCIVRRPPLYVCVLISSRLLYLSCWCRVRGLWGGLSGYKYRSCCPPYALLLVFPTLYLPRAYLFFLLLFASCFWFPCCCCCSVRC